MGVETEPDWTKAIAEPLTAPLERTAREFGEHVAIDFLGRHTTWRELSEQIDRLARGLAAIGVGKGTRVGLLLPNTPYYVASYYAIARLGAVVVNLNPLYADAEIEALLTDSGAEVVVTLDLALMLPKLLGCFERTALRRVVVASMAEALPRHMGLMFQLLRRKELIRVPDDGRCITYGRGHGHRHGRGHARGRDRPHDRPRCPAIYRRHYRPAQGCHAHPRQSGDQCSASDGLV